MAKSIRELEVELSHLEAAHTSVYYELLQARSAKLKQDQAFAAAVERAGARRRAEIEDDLPENPVARGIVLAGRRRRGEIQ